MKDDVHSHRQSSWLVEHLQLMPHLLAVRPYGLEGTYDIEIAGKPQLFYCDHGWDDTFGYAFGEVHGVGAEAALRLPDVRVGDFITFTRCAYTDAVDREGSTWLFLNWENCLAKIDADPNPENGVLIPSRETGSQSGLDPRATAA